MKRILSNILLVAASCGLGMLVAEGVVRTFYPESRDHVAPHGLLEVDPDLGWKLTPDSTSRHHSTVFDVVYRINSIGFRDEQRESTKPPNVHRVLLLGDSQIFGWGVDAGARFSNLVEERVSDLEVLNLGVPGYGLDQEILTYESRGAALGADEVIFFVSRLTLSRAHSGQIYRKDKPQFVLDDSGTLKLIAVPPNPVPFARLSYSVLGSLYLPYFIELRLALLQSVGQLQSELDRDPQQRLDDLEKKLLQKAIGIASGRQQKVTLLSGFPYGPNRDLEEFCAQNQITCISLAADGRDPDDRLGPQDPHLNPQANLRLAEEFLRQWERPPR